MEGKEEGEGKENEGERNGEGEQEHSLGVQWTFENSKPAPSDTPSPTNPHLLILPKWFQLGAKHPEI